MNIETLGGLVASGFGGSFIGALGGLVSKYMEFRQAKQLAKIQMENKKLDQAHELAMANVNLQVQDQITEMELAKASYAGLTASMEADRATYSVGTQNKWLILVDIIRGLMRPLLTGGLVVFIAVYGIYLIQTFHVEPSAEQVLEMVNHILQCLITSTGLAVSWWFGSRPHNFKPRGRS